MPLLEALLKASAGGLVVFFVAWGVCRAFPKLHPAVRFWLWWLVAARLVFGLLLAGLAVPLPVLKPTRAMARTEAVKATPTIVSAVPQLAVESKATAKENVLPPVVEKSGPAQKPIARFPWIMALLYLWGAGVLALLGRSGLATLKLRRQLGRLEPDATGVAISEDVTSPLVVGLLRPVVVLPKGLAENERAMALAHERAHITRGDLWLGLVLTLARALFWFHPVVYKMVREAEQAREEACDRAARQSGARPASYGRFLLRVSGERPVEGLGMAAFEHDALKRRLLALNAAPTPASRRALVGVGLAGVTMITPWKLTAARPVTVVPPAALPQQTWKVVPLGDGYSDAFSISDAGQVVGTAGGGQGKAFRYDSRTESYDTLGTFGRSRSVARAVNGSGQVALAAYSRSDRPRGWVAGSGERKLSGLSGYPYVQPLGLNDVGTVVGSARRSVLQGDVVAARAFASRQGRVRDLGTLGGPYSHAFGINAQGQIVGKADLAPRPRWVATALGLPPVTTHAFLWEAGQMRDLGTLGGDTSRAHAINNSGEVVGQAQTASGENRAFLWDSGQMHELPTLPGDTESTAHAVSSDGRVVGSATDASGERRAIVWEGGVARDLNLLLPAGSGWRLTVARGINARGEIVGQGIFKGKPRAFLLRPEVHPAGNQVQPASHPERQK
ncbi:MAG: M56 family metallopeptidase [Armatimonas sp.]